LEQQRTEQPSYEELVHAYKRLKAKHEQLKSASDLHQIILYHTADLIAVVDTNGKRIWNNRAYFDTLGYTSDELEDTNSFIEIHPDDRGEVEEVFRETIQTGIGRQQEYRMKHKSGNWVRLESRARAVTNDEGEVESIVIMARDITDRQLLETELNMARNRAARAMVSERLGSVFDQTIDQLVKLVEELKRMVPIGQKERTDIESRLEKASRSHHLLDGLLALGKGIDSEDLHPVRMDLLIHRVVKKTIPSGGLAREIITIHDPCQVKGSEALLQKVLENILTNSVEAMTQRGVIRVELMRWIINREQALRYGGILPGEYSVVAVRDQGGGIPPEEIGRVCEPFFSTKEGHEGLGLTMAEVIVNVHGGFMQVKSRSKISTEILALLPRYSEETKKAEEHMNQPEHTILVMEKEPMVRAFLVRILADLGYDVLSSESIEDTGEQVKNGMNSREFPRIDLIMGSFLETEFFQDWLNYMREIDSSLRFIVTTSDKNHPILKNYAQHGLDAVLTKPFTVEVIKSTMNRIY